MAWVNPTTPNLADFTTYCTNEGIVASYTASGSEYFQWAFDWALYDALTCAQMPASLYVHAVYNMGADRFIRIAQDGGQGTFYQTQRAAFHVLDFRPGVVMASGDGPTSQTLVVPEWYREIPMMAQEMLKTPWGRQYIAYAQMYGDSVVGVS
ncbi:MAG: hypothetical protein ACYCRF_11420 [Acidithiobacillus sp.]